MLLASDFLRDDLVDVAPSLLSLVFNSSFQPFEFMDACPLVSHETSVALADPKQKVMDSLYQAAFRTGLGNSLFAKDVNVDDLKRADLFDFASKNITLDNISVVGSGVDHAELSALVESFTKNFNSAKKSESTASKSAYYGGEVRIDAGASATAHYCLAYPGVSLKSPDYPTSLVVKSLLDGVQRVKYGSPSGHCSLLANDSCNSVTAFSKSHSDAGLIGIYITGTHLKVCF